MRDRVDAFGVAEPELQLIGGRQIEVNLPGVANADRAAEQVGSTAQLYFYDWEANILDSECKTNDTEVNGGQQPITGLRAAVVQAGEVHRQKTSDASVAASAPRFYAFNKVSKQPFERAGAGLQAGRARRARRRRTAPTRRSSRSPRACSSSATRRARPARTASSRRSRPLVGDPRPPGAVGHRHQEPRAELRPAAAAATRSSRSTSRTRAARRSRTSRAGSPSAARQHAPGREPASTAPSTSRSSSTTSWSPRRSSTTRRTRTASTARPARRSPAASRSRRRRTWRRSSRSARCRSSSS